jgi:endoglucanase Acf2
MHGLLLLCLALMANSAMGQGAVSSRHIQLGAAKVHLQPKGSDESLPFAPHRSPALMGRAAPTSQWYSTLIFSARPNPVYAQPLSVRPTAEGLELSLPQREVWPTPRRDTQVAYPHREPIVLSSSAFDDAAGPIGSRLEASDDWSVRLRVGPAQEGLHVLATVARGSPYVHLEMGSGDLRLRIPAGARRIDKGEDPRRLALRLGARHYAFFLPTGGHWEAPSGREWIGRLPIDRRYASAAVLPDDSPDTLALISRHAYVHTRGTRVAWSFDARRSRVTTTFTALTETKEGEDVGPLYGLYPHHWHQNESVSGQLGPSFDTVRGPLRLLAARDFQTEYPFFGFVPLLPGLSDPEHRRQVRELTTADIRNARRMMLPEGQSAYWQGKGLLRILKLADVLDREGSVQEAEQLLQGIRRRMEEWLGGEDRKRYFFFDRRLGVLASHPNEFHAIEEINDQHFWFGYWIRAAADLALRDRGWADPQRWGAVIDLMVANIANFDRELRELPFLRNFDPYEGHSWANGLGGVGEPGFLGNNQESSSEALNAWAGLLLWAEVRGDRPLRDLAAYLYATEWQAVEHYWFDVHRIVLPPQYQNVDVAILFGAGYAHNTWWTDEPRQITGINLLPITTSSLPLGRNPEFIKRNLEALREEQILAASRGVRGKPPDIWQDIFAKYQALADPEAGLKMWNRWGSVEQGETRSATLHWILSLRELGRPDFSITADHPLHTVLARADGRRTYLAYNAGAQPLMVRFSDGVVLEVPPGQLVQKAIPADLP